MIRPYDDELSGDELLAALAALANPHRLRIIAALFKGPVHVSQLARDVGLGRPLLYMHLRRMEAARLVEGTLELSKDGKALKMYSLTDWSLSLSPESVARAAGSLSAPASSEPEYKSSHKKE
ncbi:MAG: winged helix-turn-helix transcriptional regulator [Actinobacteria bacterium]|nr:winged helix-turn-helix transcriptional regulator [Actinomycetota bacterium]